MLSYFEAQCCSHAFWCCGRKSKSGRQAKASRRPKDGSPASAEPREARRGRLQPRANGQRPSSAASAVDGAERGPFASLERAVAVAIAFWRCSAASSASAWPSAPVVAGDHPQIRSSGLA